MRRSGAAMVLALVLGPGCASQEKAPVLPASPFTGLFEPIEVLENGTALLPASIMVIEAGADPAWGAAVTRTGEGLRIAWQREFRLAKTEPGRLGGGGTELPLFAPTVNLTLRLRQDIDLRGYEVEWGLQNSTELPAWLARRPAVDPTLVAFSLPGTLDVYARLWQEGDLKAKTFDSFELDSEVEWTVYSSIHPIKPPEFRPPNYAEMADRFPMPFRNWVDRLRVQTMLDPSWVPPDGWDVDLEIVNENEGCQWRGEPPDGLPSSAAYVTEKVIEKPGVAPQAWTVNVGALQECDGTTTAYTNTAMVPYILTIQAISLQP